MTRWHYKRKHGMTLEQRVYRALQKNPGVNGPALQQLLNANWHQVRGTIRRLRAKGCIETVGRTSSSRYYATDVKPDDWRGAAPGSIKALMTIARTRTRKRVTRPRRLASDCTLQEVWR